MFKLRSWIDETKLTRELSCNPNAVEYLEEYPKKIDYCHIFKNINAIHIIEKNLDKIDSYNLHANPNMINLLRNHRNLVICENIFAHEHAIEFINELIKKHKLNYTQWALLSYNSAAIHILEQHPEKINWECIICNKKADHLIHNNLEKVEKNWYHISRQPHLISLIETYPENINWHGLSFNYNAIHLLRNNLEKIDIDALRFNENGFELLLLLGHQFNNNTYYNKNIVYAYWDYCKSRNIEFTLTNQLCEYGYTDEHFEFIKQHVIYYEELTQNPHIFVYDYSRMKKTRQQQPWYQDIKNEFI